jgi:hypothetical protein
MTLSARALSYESPTVPTEGQAKISSSRSALAIEVY